MLPIAATVVSTPAPRYWSSPRSTSSRRTCAACGAACRHPRPASFGPRDAQADTAAGLRPQGRPAAQARRRVRLRRPHNLGYGAGRDDHGHPPLREGDRASMGPAAPAAHPPGGLDRLRRPAADHRRHRRPPGRGEAAQRRGEQARLAVVVGHRRHRDGRRPLLAVLPSPLRHRAHVSPVQADARVDQTSASQLGSGRPVDMAGDRGICPTPTGPTAGHRPAAALGEADRAEQTDTSPRPQGVQDLHAKTGSPAGAPKPSQPGPGRPPGSKNRCPAPRHDVGRILATFGTPLLAPRKHGHLPRPMERSGRR